MTVDAAIGFIIAPIKSGFVFISRCIKYQSIDDATI